MAVAALASHSGPVKPLGVLSPQGRAPFALSREDLLPLAGTLGEEARPLVARYLQSGTIVLALMEHTTDVISGSFDVSGGSAVLTDGTYYWRCDASEYVATYGIEIGQEALEHMRQRGWNAPTVGDRVLAEIDAYLYALLGA